MDPNQTLKDLLGAFIEQGKTADTYPRQEALDALDNLRDWLRNDGFMPTVTEHNGNYRVGE